VVQAAVYAKPDSASDVKQAIVAAPKLSKPTKSGSGAVALDAGELMEIQEEIRKLEKAASKQTKATDPFDAKIFNSKFRNDDPPEAQKPNSPRASSGQK
jgi:valyl-tRNA synthetase